MKDVNKGTLGENLYRKNDKHPDMKGKCNIEGQEYNISGWLKEGKNGSFYSLSFTVREDKPDPEAVGSKLIKPRKLEVDVLRALRDDEVPF